MKVRIVTDEMDDCIEIFLNGVYIAEIEGDIANEFDLALHVLDGSDRYVEINSTDIEVDIINNNLTIIIGGEREIIINEKGFYLKSEED